MLDGFKSTGTLRGVLFYDGEKAEVITLTNLNGMTASFMDIGATWLSCILPVGGEKREVLLRSPDMESFKKQSAYFGAVVGRFANRIRDGRFTLNDHKYQITRNNGKHSLHGGEVGFDSRRWNIEYHSFNQAIFTLTSEDREQGFPGKLEARVTYTLTDKNQLDVEYFAVSSQPTAVNLTNHAYFNLAGEDSGQTVLTHSLKILASHYLPTDNELIPTGEIKSVKGTGFDFTRTKSIEKDFLVDADQRIAGGYDHAFVFDRGLNDGEEDVIKLMSPGRDLVLRVRTTKPAVQLYTGNFLEGTPGLSGEYVKAQGLCLETQYLPDGPNHPEWGRSNGILRAGEEYKHRTVFSFDF
ncbi:galactose-1-epimerase [Veronia nyctiphanis]|uniref:Aldose 1-epimerase n=1 Tax=Veronia nyctiphanis TaxID=1278244 RepID=A0A4Q0YJH4_9GAMM|nr:galactose-1-epimerase [Veronia nyctiphanis]RXJ70870.1 galactose-1-epimerase [Veronia nyctiphanis]